MTFADEVLKSESERFFLVEITSRLDLGLGTSIGGGQYTFNVGQINVKAVYVNSVATTWTFADGVLTVDSASDLTSSSNYTIIDRGVYLTGTKHRITDSVAGLPDAEWEPRIQNYPSFSQSMRNIAEGVFSLSASELSIISTDGLYQSLTKKEASLANAPVRIWVCVNSLENNRLVFVGQTTNCSYRYGVMTIGLQDNFKKLKELATFGNRGVAYNFVGNTGKSRVQPADQNKPNPVTFGYGTPFTVKPGWRHLDPYDQPNGPAYHIDNGLKAVYVGPSTYPLNSDTVTFSAGRIYGDILRLNFGTISAAYEQWIGRLIPIDPKLSTSTTVTVIIYDKITYLQCSSHNCQIGDYIPNLNGWVCQIANSGFGSYNLAVASPVYGVLDSQVSGSLPASGPISVPSIPNNTIPAMSVWVDDGDAVDNIHSYLTSALNPDFRVVRHSRRYLQFTPTLTPYTYNAYNFNEITFTINPLTSGFFIPPPTIGGPYNGLNSVSPLNNSNVQYAYRLATQVSHSEMLKIALTTAGLSVNNTTFTQAASDLSADVSITLPINESDKEHSTYLSLCQAVTGSTLGTLGINENSEIEYKVFNPSSSVEATRDQTEILNDSAGASLEYQDIHTKVQFEHAQIKPLFNSGNLITDNFSESPKDSFLQRSELLKVVTHYLRDITAVVPRFFGYFKSPTVEYNISTASKDLTTLVGDVVEVSNKIVANESSVVKGVVVSVNSGSSKTDVKINELRGV